MVVGAGLLTVQEWAAGVGILSMGAAALLLVTERSVSVRLPDRTASGSVHALAALGRELELHGHGFVFPSRDANGSSRLFIAASPTAGFEDLPAVESGPLGFQRSPERALGVTVPPPGVGLEDEWRALHGLPQGAGAEEALLHIRRAFPGLEIGEAVTVTASAEVIRVEWTPAAGTSLAFRTRSEWPPWHLQGADPATSFAALLVARAFAAPVRIVDAGSRGARVFVDLEVGPRATK